VFDMAGTTVKDKNNVGTAFLEALADEGIHVTLEQVNQVMGYPKPIAIEKLLEIKLADKSEINPKYIGEIHSNFVSKMVNYYQTSKEVGEKEGVQETFAALKKAGVYVGIDTGFDRKIANTIFNRLGWVDGETFDFSVTSDEVENGRPYPDMIEKLMEMTGVTDVKQVAKVGDTQSDLLQGKAAGCALVVGVTTGSWKKEDLAKEYHTHLIAELPEILDIIGIYQNK
jgi:phosphonatase-like hydrolase